MGCWGMPEVNYMVESEITLQIHLEVRTRRDAATWIAWCPPLDLLSQGKTKTEAVASLREAVDLWFESCVQRGVLDKALTEAGFQRGRDSESIPADASVVRFRENKTHVARHAHRPRPSPRYISVSVPAYSLAHPVYADASC